MALPLSVSQYNRLLVARGLRHESSPSVVSSRNTCLQMSNDRHVRLESCLAVSGWVISAITLLRLALLLMEVGLVTVTHETEQDAYYLLN